MSEQFRLLFRGDVLDGQHPAVVRRKLGQLLGLDDSRVGRLFSGQLVIVKAAADASTAERIEATFRKAGAHLEVELVAGAEHPVPVASRPEPPSAGRVPASTSAPGASAFAPEVLPVGSDVLREEERAEWVAREIDTAHLNLQVADAKLPEAPPAPPAPDTSRLSLRDL